MRLAAILLVLTAATASAQGFNAVYTKNGTDVWAVGDAGAIWRTYDSGTTWTQLPALGIKPLRGVAARGLNAIAVGDSGRVYRSSNLGGTWSLSIVSGVPDLRGVEWPADNAAYAVGGNGGIWISSDNGATWNPQTSGTAQRLNAIRFRDSTNGWAVGANGVALKTTNGGVIWSATTTGTTRELRAVDYVGSTAWAVGDYGTALRTSNAGANWNPVNLNMDSQSDVRGVWLDPTGTTVTLTGGGGFLRSSSNAGATWTWAIHPLLGPTSDYFAFGSKAWLVSSTLKAVARTTDGVNWQFGNSTNTTWAWNLKFEGPVVITRGNTFATTPQNRNSAWVVIGQYIFKSVDRGDNWALLDSIPNCIKTNSFYVSPKDSTHWVAAVGTPDRIMRTLNNGGSWTATIQKDFSEYGMPLEMHPDKPDTFFFAPEDGRLYRSKDFAATWDTLSNPGFRSPCDIVVVPGDDSKIVVGDGVTGSGFGNIFQSTNGGLNFTLKYTGPSSEVPTVWGNRLENNVIFAANWSNGGVWKSTDYGATWNQSSIVSSAWGGAISNDDPKAVGFNRYAGIPNYISTDQGVTYTSSNLSAPGSGYAMLGLDRSTWLDLHSFGVYKLAVNQTMASNANQSLALTAPVGGESWNAGSIHQVTWTSTGIGLVRIEYRTGPAQPWTLVADVEGYLGVYDWTVPSTPTNTAELRVSDAWDASPADQTPSTFTILGPGLSSTPSSIAFGSHPVGTVTVDAVTVTNTGNTALHLTSISTGSTIFTPNRTAVTIGPGLSDTVGVAFRPVAGTTYNATLSIPNDAGATVTVPLSGTGDATSTIVVVTPKGGDGWQYNKSYNVTWQSVGVTSVAVEYQTTSVGPWLTIADPVPAANGTTPWVIPNSPTTQARVRVRQNGGGLTGMSPTFSITVPSFVVSSPYDFGSVTPNYATWDTLHIDNPGTAPVTITNVTSDNPKFKVARTSFTIPAADFDTLAFWYKPTATGPDSALITFTDDTPAGSHTLRARGQGQSTTGASDMPLAFALEPNLPNPFALRTTIRFALPRASNVRIEVFDLAGRRVRTLVDGPREAGLQAVPFEPGPSAASGVYFVRMTAGAFEATRKMLYLVR